MRAAFYERTGPAKEVLQLGEISTPLPGPGEVRVRLQWSGVNPSDVKSRKGRKTSNPPGFPRVIPHSDGAGVIDEVGDGVPRTRIGQRVWTWNAGWRRAFGTAAEYVVLPAAQAVRLPENVEMAAGACLGIPALTACHAAGVDGGVSGKRVLVSGGAGAVGHYAVQFARHGGASQIIATVSGSEKAAAARSAGAHIVINYKTDDVVARIMDTTSGHGVDRIIDVDATANISTDLQVLHDDGIIVVYGSGAEEIPVPFFPAILKNAHLRFFAVYTLTADARALANSMLMKLLEGGALVHNIAARLKLDQIAEAHDLVEQGRVIGNVVLEIG